MQSALHPAPLLPDTALVLGQFYGTFPMCKLPMCCHQVQEGQCVATKYKKRVTFQAIMPKRRPQLYPRGLQFRLGQNSSCEAPTCTSSFEAGLTGPGGKRLLVLGSEPSSRNSCRPGQAITLAFPAKLLSSGKGCWVAVWSWFGCWWWGHGWSGLRSELSLMNKASGAS